jgi:hypothetical protein
MTPVDQIEFRPGLGDCGRACLASIFGFTINEMPNFWEDTQDASTFWKLQNSWIDKNHSHRLIPIAIAPGHEDLIDGLLCIAVGRSNRSDEEHAVVWKNGIIHDPHPSRAGLHGDPECFVLIVPIDQRFD